VSTLTARSAPRTIIGLLAALGLVAALTMPALASHVEPTPVNEGNPTCSDFDANWLEVKVDPPADGVYTDGTLTVTISNYADNQFDWESNIGVDAVFVKAGSDKHNLYVYNPEATEDDGLTAQDGQGNGISHISFCYDIDVPEESEAEESMPEESQPEESQPEESQPEESEVAEESAPAESIREDTQGGNPTPTGGTLPDTAVGQFGQIPATVLSLVLMGALAATVYVRLARQR
jgi:hypothetical protein